MKKENRAGGAGRRIWPWFAAAAAAAVAVTAVLAAAALASVKQRPVEVDLSPFLEKAPGWLFTNRTASVRLDFSRGSGGGWAVRADGSALGFPFSAEANVKPSLRLFGASAQGDAKLRIDGSPWRLRADFDVSSSGEWRFDAEMPEVRVDESDPVLGAVLARMPAPAVSNIAFCGGVSLWAQGRRTRETPVPRWSASLRISGLDASLFLDGRPLSVEGLRASAGASGIADHVDVAPMFPRADRIDGAGISLSNVFASVRATESSWLVTEAGAGFCGGELRLYSLFLDPAKLNAGATVLVDGVEAGEVLRMVKGFEGEASGRLYGKMPVYLRNGRELRLREAYLHSVPGEVGTLRVYDPAPVAESLALGGVPEDARRNVAAALADLSYSALKIRLAPEDDGMALSVNLDGSATRGGVTVPVSFGVTFHGDVEQMLNTGIRAASAGGRKKEATR